MNQLECHCVYIKKNYILKNSNLPPLAAVLYLLLMALTLKCVRESES